MSESSKRSHGAEQRKEVSHTSSPPHAQPEGLAQDGPVPHRRRHRYAGKYPRRFEEKYKEHRPELYPETIEKVKASGKTPAGSHRPIMVDEVLEVLAVGPGMTGVDCTLGWG